MFVGTPIGAAMRILRVGVIIGFCVKQAFCKFL